MASGSARLFSKADCPIKTESILDDYDEELARSPTLLALVRLIIEFSSNEFVGRSKTRFCAEFFSRRHEAKAELGPHHDGATVLFFLILENSMQGGELRLFRKPPVETAARSSSVNSLETLPGQRGDGYCILETASAKSGQILHGCGMWHLPKIGTGDRRSLRVSVACV